MSNHINQKVLQRRRGGSALQRLAYQTCTYYNNGKSHADYSRFAGDHRGGVVLLPYGSDPEFGDECNFVMAVAFRETRVDAQEGRAVDFALPRELPEELLLPVAGFGKVIFLVVVVTDGSLKQISVDPNEESGLKNASFGKKH